MVYSKIDMLSPEEIENRKRFDRSIEHLLLCWEAYKKQPGQPESEALISAFNSYDEHNLYSRAREPRIIRQGLLRLWKTTGEPIHLDLLTQFIDESDGSVAYYTLKLLRKPRKGTFKAIKTLEKKHSNKLRLRLGTLGKIISHPFVKLAKSIGRILKRAKQFVWRRLRYIFITRRMYKKGYSQYMAYEWLRVMNEDLRKEKDYTLRQKIWCFRRGIRPWRMPQYGITKENYKEFLSDRDYCYIHPINNSFVKWINDKVTFRYVLDPFKDYLPKCYFHILKRYGGRTQVIPLIDCPEGYEPSYEGILSLLRDKGDLAYKMSSGTHGIGFRRLSYRDGIYFMNNLMCHENDIIRVFNSSTSFFAITEYIVLHNDLRKIYPESVNTIRVMVINEDGISPKIHNAFMRIGSSKTGTTDNVGSGGYTADINHNTGEYTVGEFVVNHVITECHEHSDTGVALAGTIPHWDLIMEKIPLICKHMPQLEYLGFDIAITEDGFCILEINVHQDLHRYPRYSPEVKEYLMNKLEQKQRRFGGRYKRR